MPNIPYTALNFGTKLPAPGGIISTSWAKLLWSAATVGKRDARELLKDPLLCLKEILIKAGRVDTYYRTEGDFVVKSSLYSRLDPTEKGHVEYDIGQTNAKLVAERLFDTPWLMHLSLYQKDLNITFQSDERPDLIGLTRSSEWIVVEAKGTGGKLSKQILEKAKRQTQAVSTINGQRPKLRLVVGAQFDKKGTLELQLRDPDDLERVPGIEIDMNVFFRSYYQPILNILALGERPRQFIWIGDRQFDVVELTELDIQLGLDSELTALLKRRESAAEQILAYLRTVPTTSIRPREINRIPIEIASDGIIVIPGPQWGDFTRSIDKLDDNDKFGS